MNLSPLRKLPLDKPRILWQGGAVYSCRGCPGLRASKDLARKGVSYLDRIGPSCLDTARSGAFPMARRHGSGLFLCPEIETSKLNRRQ